MSLDNLKILVVEDEYLLAMALRAVLVEAGAEVLGPVSTVAQAQHIISNGRGVDVAVLDVNLGKEMVYPVADTLMALGIPCVLTTGFDGVSLDERYRHMERFEKPYDPEQVVAQVDAVMQKVATDGLPHEIRAVKP